MPQSNTSYFIILQFEKLFFLTPNAMKKSLFIFLLSILAALGCNDQLEGYIIGGSFRNAAGYKAILSRTVGQTWGTTPFLPPVVGEVRQRRKAPRPAPL